MRYDGRPMAETPHPRVRFAPSPTGYLHLGSARTGLYNFIFARQHEGTFVLRIEDTDLSRSTDEAIVQIISSMKEMGLQWDEGPGAPGPHGPYRQTERDGIYHEHVARLLESGHLYPCFCTAEELEAERTAAQAGGPRLGVLGQVPGAGRGRGPAPPGGRRAVHAARARARRPHRLPRHPARRRRLRERHHGRLHRAALGRHRHLQPRRRRRRRHHGDHPRHPRRRPHQQHAQAGRHLRGARRAGARVPAHAAALRHRQEEAQQAARRHQAGAAHRRGVPRRGGAQLPVLPERRVRRDA